MAEISSESIYEGLKAVQRDVSNLKSEVGDVKLEMNAIRLVQNAARQEVIEIHTEITAMHATFICHEKQLDRIERRLELNDAPTQS